MTITDAIKYARNAVHVDGAQTSYWDANANAWRTQTAPNAAYARAWAWGARVAIALAQMGVDPDTAARLVFCESGDGRWTDAARRLYAKTRP